jgi:uncharacterized repeat protein (TIGR04076 family)
MPKVTVLKRMVNQDLIDKYQHQTTAPCDIFVDGQEFMVDDWGVLPQGFCQWAWEDIQKKIQLAQRIETAAVACCTDGFRPVVFEIEPAQ